MPYNSKIKTLEETHRLIENQIFHLEKAGNPDPVKLKNLQEQKTKYLNELRSLRRLQWDHDHETVNFDDDR
jgi:hypothetical protein